MNCSVPDNTMPRRRTGGSYAGALLLVGLLCCASTAGAEELLEQQTISIKGNPGLPRTLYIAPWKRVGTPLASGAPDGGMRVDVEPLERDLFQHELQLRREGYNVLHLPLPQTQQMPAPADNDAGIIR